MHLDLEHHDTSLHFLRSIVKDAILLKRGVLIYLKHLVPYFSRVAEYPDEEYPLLRASLWDEVSEHITQNKLELEELQRKLLNECSSLADIPLLLQLEELRAMVESEIFFELFAINL